MVAAKLDAASLQGVRIARVSTVPYFVATQLAEQIKFLARVGARVTVITSPGPELRRLASDEISIEVVDIPRSLHPLRDAAALFQLYRCFQRHRFDIVHSTTPKAGLLCAIAGWLARIPIRLHTFTGQPWVNLTGPLRVFAKGADWVIGHLTTRCYADSASQRAFLIAEGMVAAARIGVLGKGSLAGVSLRRFDPARWSMADKAALRGELNIATTSRVLLFVGRVTHDKGINELLRVFNTLRQEGRDLILLLVGPLDGEHGGGIGMALDQPHVRHVGYSDCPEKYMAIADLLCLPSYREGFGTVVIEAAAMGLPTLGTRIYGLTDAVEDGVTGMLVPPRDVESLAAAMRRMLDEPGLLDRMGRAAQDRCREYFDSAKLNALQMEEYIRLRTS